METDFKPASERIRFCFEPVAIDCSWCESEVPLPEGDLVGVCIKCGAVVFRAPEDRMRAGNYSISRNREDIPTPA
jgi:hypothetical protein